MSEYALMQSQDAKSPDNLGTLFEIKMLDKKSYFFCKYPQCDKSFRFRSEIERHIATHTNVRPFVCTYKDCNKAFKRLDALENHTRIHTKETPFKCDFEGCNKEFTTKASLRYHLLKHKDEKIYKCSFPGCNKAFITLFQLKQHEKAVNYHKKLQDSEEAKSESYEAPVTQEPEDRMFMQFAQPQKRIELDPKIPLANFFDKPPRFAVENAMTNVYKENELLKQRLQISERLVWAVIQQRMTSTEASILKTQLNPELAQYSLPSGFFSIEG